MSMIVNMFSAFIKLWIVIFGGGYAMLPLLQSEMISNHWLTTGQLTDLVAVSAMAPGPIATNTAAIVGFRLDSIPGAIIATLALTIPSLIVIIFVGKLFVKYQHHRNVKAAFYGLRPAIIGIIIYAAINFAVSNNIVGGKNIIDVKSTILMVVGFIILIKTKLHPIYLILGAAVIGIILSII